MNIDAFWPVSTCHPIKLTFAYFGFESEVGNQEQIRRSVHKIAVKHLLTPNDFVEY